MKLPGFIGPTYQLRSRNVSVEECINLLPQLYEGQVGPNQIFYDVTQGLTQVANLPDGPHRCHFAQDGRAFAVAGQTLFEVFADNTYVSRGTVAQDGSPASMASNGVGGHQLLVVSGGKGYIFDLNANTLTQITAASFPTTPLMCGFIDGYFVILDSDANSIHLSGLENGLTWSGLDVAQRSTASDNLVSMIVGERQVRLSGTKTGETWFNSGAANFPFQPIPGSYINQGSACAWSGQNFDNSFMWVIANESGGGVVARAEGYLPKRVSTHGIERELSLLSTMKNLESWTWEYDGHAFYVLYAPGGPTLVYDASTNMWHKWMWNNVVSNALEAHRGRCHMYIFEQHYVGDRVTGQLYTLSPSVYSDAGTAIHRIRIFPHLRDELNWMFYNHAELDCDKGIGLGLASQQGFDPQVWLSWSDDAGNTWSSEYFADVGKQGEYDILTDWWRLGRARRRTFKLRGSDPVPYRWVNFFIDVDGGTS